MKGVFNCIDYVWDRAQQLGFVSVDEDYLHVLHRDPREVAEVFRRMANHLEKEEKSAANKETPCQILTES